MSRQFPARLLAVGVLCAILSLLLLPGVASAAGVVKSDAGEWYSLAVLSDGTMWGWGYNAQGQLGDGTLDTHLAPSRVDDGTSWLNVSTGYRHALAIKTDGTLWSWGYNKDGQLGLGTADLEFKPGSPTQVGSASNWLEIAAGRDHSVALDTQGRIWAWGANSAGQLGIGTTTASWVPIMVSDAPGPGLFWRWVSADDATTLALASDGSLWRWGGGITTPLLVGFTGPFVDVAPTSDSGWLTVSSAAGRICAVTSDFKLWTWLQTTTDPKLTGIEYRDVAETSDADQTPTAELALMIKQDRSLWIATNDFGTPAPLSSATKTYLIGNALNWTRLRAGTNHFLLSKSDGSLWGWGKNTFGQLGDGSEADKITKNQLPVRVILPTPIPNVVSRTQSDAVDKIAEMGFKVGTVTQMASNEVEVTRIISQTPAPDTLVLPGKNVNIVVSAGPPVPVPNVVGMTEEAAKAAIGHVGLGVSTVTRAYSSIVPIGAVVSQLPAAGTGVIAASKVSLTVSKGPQPKIVPYTMGRTEAAARSALQTSGFVVGSVIREYSTRYAAGLVTRTSPAAGVQAFVGDKVNVYVSRGKPKAWVRTPIAPKAMLKSRYYTVYGYLKPKHTKGTYPVRIYKWKKTSSGSWKSYGYVRAKASNYSDYTKYSKSMRLSSAGKWRLRAYAPEDDRHAGTWSARYDYVTVK